ncbi:MAG: ribonuclease H family protein [Cyclobacteriaceae bacterium]
MAKKYYVVWRGRKTGIFESWKECNKQVKGFPKAQYMSYPSLELAQKAFENGYANRNNYKTYSTAKTPQANSKPIQNSIVVDGAWNTSTGQVEYQGINLKTNEKIFHAGPLEDGTNNIAEFLAIVRALIYCKRKSLFIPIYTDSSVAMSWIRKKNARTKHPRTEKNKLLFEALDRAANWLKTNNYSNEILKWETKNWGENPADFGRK